MSGHRYYVQSHAFLCSTNHHWLVLDVAADRYLCIEKQLFQTLGPWLCGWQGNTDTMDRNRKELPAEAAKLAEGLVARGILTENAEGSKTIDTTVAPTPTKSLWRADADHSIATCAVRALQFFRACTNADRCLKLGTLEDNVRRVSERKSARAARSEIFDSARLQSLVATFKRLRLLYGRDYLCMFDSFALIEFLAYYELYPSWVFGVMSDPFCAHCWVQADDIVLNDSVERVSQYVPIMNV